MRLSGRIRKDAFNKSRIVISLHPSTLAFLVSKLTRLGIFLICSSALSSMVITLSDSGIKFDKTFKKVVFPDPVPPHTRILHPACTKTSSWSLHSLDKQPIERSSSMVIGLGGKRLIVRIGPLMATGSNTTFTLAPSESLASTIGDASLTTRLHFAVICQITCFNFSGESKHISSFLIFPFCSMKIPCVPLTMISVICGFSINSCRIPSCLIE